MHDSSYKFLFSQPELVRDLITGFVPDDWLHSLDYSTLEKVPGSYITEDFRQREDDIVWRVRAGEAWVYLYLLLEFQSSIDRYMALRVMVYVGLLYQDLIKAGQALPDGRLPPVLPIVLYNGSRPWTATTEIGDLIPKVPGLTAQFRPAMQYLLIDESAYSDTELASLKNLVAAVFRIEHLSKPEDITHLVDCLQDWLTDRPDLRRLFALWLRATLKRNRKCPIVLPQVDDLQEIRVMLSDRLEQWAEAYKAEGMQQGEQHRAMLTLQRQLTRRFGQIPPEVTARIAAAPLEVVEVWLDRILDAETLTAVFEE